jgi:hypothetical protein
MYCGTVHASEPTCEMSEQESGAGRLAIDRAHAPPKQRTGDLLHHFRAATSHSNSKLVSCLLNYKGIFASYSVMVSGPILWTHVCLSRAVLVPI